MRAAVPSLHDGSGTYSSSPCNTRPREGLMYESRVSCRKDANSPTDETRPSFGGGYCRSRLVSLNPKFRMNRYRIPACTTVAVLSPRENVREISKGSREYISRSLNCDELPTPKNDEFLTYLS